MAPGVGNSPILVGPIDPLLDGFVGCFVGRSIGGSIGDGEDGLCVSTEAPSV